MTIRKLLKSSLISKSLIAAIDQATLSGLSFIISVFLIRTVPKVEYGYYSIGFAVLLFAVSVQQAIVNTPLAVLLIEKKGEERNKYVGSLCYGQFVVIIPAVCLGLVAIALLTFGGLDRAQAWVAASVCFAMVGLLLREFLRSYMFAEERPLQVFKMDIAYIIFLLSLIILAYLSINISVVVIFIFMGIAGLLVGIFISRRHGWRIEKKAIKNSYRENWKYGKWALFGGLVTYLQNYSYLYLLGAMLGSVAVAEVSAARLLITPLILFRAGWGRIVIPRGSRHRENGELVRFFKEQLLVCFIYVVVVALYTLILFSCSGLLQKYLFTEKYINSFDYLLYWVGINVVGFFGMTASFGLQVTKKFDIISKVGVVTMFFTLGSAFWLIKLYGIKGGLTALLIGMLLGCACLWGYFIKVLFGKASEYSTPKNKKILMPKPS